MIFQTINKLSIDDTGALQSTEKFTSIIGARIIAQKNAEIQTEYDRQKLLEYSVACKNATLSTEELNGILVGTSAEAQAYALKIKAGTASVEGYTIATNTATAATKVFTIVQQTAKAALTGLVVGAIMFGISKLINIIDNAIHKTEILNESVESLMQKYRTASTNAKSHASEMQNLIPIYEKLSKGVNGLGENVSLTESEFDEYNNTVNKIAAMYPALVDGWTAQGDAIINVKDNVEALTQAYKDEQKEAYRTLLITKKDQNGNDIAKQWVDINEDKEEKNWTLSEIEKRDILTKFVNASYNDYKREFTPGGYSTVYASTISGLNKEKGQIVNGIFSYTEDELKRAQITARTVLQEIESNIESSMNNVRDVAMAYLNTNTLFEGLDEQTQSALSVLIQNLDEDVFKQLSKDMKKKGISAIGDYVNEIITKFSSSQDAKVALSSLLSIDTSKLSINELKSQVDEYINQLAILLEEDPVKLKIMLGFSYVDNLYDNADEIKNNAKNKFARQENAYKSQYVQKVGYVESLDSDWDNDFDTWYDSFVEENSINTQNEIAFWNQCINESKTREEAMDKYLSSPISSNYIDLSNEEDSKKVDELQSKIKTLGDALSAIRDGTLDEADLFQEFPELENQTIILADAIQGKLVSAIENFEKETGKKLSPELQKYFKELTKDALNANKAVKEVFDEFKNAYDVFEEFKEAKEKDLMTESILSSVAGISDRLSILVAGYYTGVSTLDEIYEELERQRDLDFENYRQNYLSKMALDENFYEHATTEHKDLVKAFNEAYNIDLKQFKTYQAAKNAVQNQALRDGLSSISKYFDVQANAFTEAYRTMEAEILASGKLADLEYLSSVKQKAKAYQKMIDELDKFVLSDVTMEQYDAVSSKLKNNAESTKSDYKELFDFFERRIEVIDQSLNKLDASLENVNGSMAKNILIAGKIGIVSEEIKDYTSALAMYEDQANKELSKLSSDLQDKIKNGAVNITTLMGESGEEVNKILTDYQNWANKVNDCNQKLIELKETLRDLALDKFNNVVQDYTDEFELLGSSSNLIEKQISLFEEAGQIIGKAFYEAQIDASMKQRNLLEREKAALINELSSSIANGYIQKGTDEWLEMVKSIQEVDESIIDCDQSIEQLQNSILELSDQAFERLQNQFSDLKNQLNNINSLIDEIDVSDEEGVWSKEGLTRLGMFAEQYELARHNVEKYQEQIEQLNDSYANGMYSTTEYLEKLSDLTEQQWSEALAAEDAKKSIMDLNKARVDLIKEGIQKQIDKYKELIDAQKEALDQDKDLRDWQKTLAEKNKNITKLQNQIAVLSNDDSASANAKRIKLQQELNEALEDLEETQYDHSIEKQKEALDKQMEDFEDEKQKEIDALEEYLEDVEKVQKDSFDVIKNNTSAIAETINELVKTHGVIVSDTITNSWKQGENAIAAYGETLAVGTSGFMAEVNEIELYLAGLVEDADTTAEGIANIFNQKADNLVAELNSTRDTELDLLNATQALQNALIQTLEGGYDNSKIINSLKEIQDEMQKTVDTANGNGSAYVPKKDDPNKDDPDKNTNNTPNKSTQLANAVNSTLQKAVSLIKDTASKATTYSPGSGAAQGQASTSAIDAQNARRAEEQKASIQQQKQNKQNELNNLDAEYRWTEYWNPNTGKYSAAYEQLARATQYSKEAANQKNTIDDDILWYKAKKASILQKYSYLDGYAVGVHKLKADEMAWTQELGQEAILSPTRNAILTKLNKGDTVLTAEQTDNLFKLSKIDPSTIFGKLKMPTYSSKTMTPVLTIGNVLTVQGNIDDSNVEKMKGFVNTAITKAFKDFSSEIIKR